MIMIGCDFHPGLQELCLLDTETGRRREQWLSHDLGPAPAREFYADLSKPAGFKTRKTSTFSSPFWASSTQIPKSGNQPNFPKEFPPEIHPNTITLKQ